MKQRGTNHPDSIAFNLEAENKQIQKALDWRTRELQDYVDNAAIGLHWVNRNGIIIWANKAELDMLGYTEDEYIGHHIAEFHVERDKIRDILTRLSRNETLNGYESVLRCKDGSTKIVQISSNVFWDEGKFIHTRCFTIDVTEQKKLFVALKESENRYRSLVNSLPMAVYTCDQEGRITYFNEVAVKLWGYRPDIKESSLRFCACFKVWLMDGTFVPPDKTPMAVAVTTGQSFRDVEAIVERPDGSKFYAVVNIDPVLDEQNKVIGAINVFQDITALKQTEIALRESESRYRNLINGLATPLYTTDVEGTITMYNKAAAELWGWEPEIGKDKWCGSYKIFQVDGSELPLDQCPMAICLKERRPVYGKEIIVMRPDGLVRNVAPYPQPIYDISGNMTGAINMLIDITEIKRTEQALRESEKKYRNLSDALEKMVEAKTQDLKEKNEELKKSEERYHKMVEEVEDYAIILLDKDGIVQNWNKGAEKIKGYREEEIVGKSFSTFYLPDDREAGLPRQLLQKASKQGKTVHEGWRQKKDGTRFWGNIVLTALHDADNNIIGFSKVTRDLTERKLAEDRMKEYSRQLEFQNKELEQFAYAASHDMKEPLRKIHMYSSAICEDTASQLSDKSQEYLKRSMAAASRMTELIDDLLDYSRTTTNLDGYEKVDLNKVVEEVILLHKDDMDHQKAIIEFNNLPVVEGVPFQFKQLMDNLIGNAVKYKHPDRQTVITISAETIPGSQIKQGGTEPGRQYHKISVTDNGLGFEQKYAEKIFDIFQRLNNRSSTSGSGIGLAICKRIVQNHKGIIRAEGMPNKGARFDIYLPVEL